MTRRFADELQRDGCGPTLAAAIASLIAAAPGSLWWVHFADDMSKDPQGWTYVVPWGLTIAVIAGLLSYLMVFIFLRLTIQQSPHWIITAILGLIAGLAGVPAAWICLIALFG